MKNLRDIVDMVDDNDFYEEEIITEAVKVEDEIDIQHILKELKFNIDTHCEPLNESVNGSYEDGVEAGLEMASRMLDRVIRGINNV